MIEELDCSDAQTIETWRNDKEIALRFSGMFPFTPIFIRAEELNQFHFKLSDQDGNIQSYLCLELDGVKANFSVMTLEGSRENNLATNLIQHAEKMAQSKGCCAIWAGVEKDNIPMISLLQKQGFKESQSASDLEFIDFEKLL